MIKRIIKKLKTFNNLINNADFVKRTQIDTYCNSLLNNLAGKIFLPHTRMSMSAYGLLYLLNEITINNRKNIIEFGSGISTILMARLASINNLDLNIISIDDDEEWINKMKEFLANEDLTKYVKFVFAPLRLNKNNYEWYQEDAIDQSCVNHKFDLVLIDGPKAYLEGKGTIRYGALPYIYTKLNSDNVIFLDDANREGEKQIISKWEEEFKLKFNIENNLAIAYKGKFYFSNPI